jgi:hypothetical protein
MKTNYFAYICVVLYFIKAIKVFETAGIDETTQTQFISSNLSLTHPVSKPIF